MSPIAPDLERDAKYLTFKLGRQEFGLELTRVREILALPEVTVLPLAPKYLLGVINLRGRVVPVIDLRVKLGMAATEHDSRKCIIVCDVMRGGQPLQMSILVDSVSEVLHVGPRDLSAAPALDEVDTSFIVAIAKSTAGMKLLIDVDIMLSTAQVTLPSAMLA